MSDENDLYNQTRDLEAALDKHTYDCKVICGNCGDFHKMRIIKECSVASQSCPTCGCKQLTIRPQVTL